MISLVNLKNKNRIANTCSVILGVVALVVFPLGVKILDVVTVITSCLAAAEICRTNRRQPSHFEQHQADLFASLIAAVVLAPVMQDPIHSFVDVLKIRVLNISLVMLGVVVGLVFYGHRRIQTDNTRSNLVSYTALSLVTSTIFLEGRELVLSSAAIALAAIGAYLSLQKHDRVIIDVEPKNSKPCKRSDRRSTDTAKVVAVVGLTLFLMASHLDTFNPDMNFAIKLLNSLESHRVKSAAENTTIIDSTPNQFNVFNITEGVRKQLRHQCLHKTRALIQDLVLPYFKPDKPFTLMDYPNYWNLGDSFIYAGTEQLFRIYGQMSHRLAFPYDNYGSLKNVR